MDIVEQLRDRSLVAEQEGEPLALLDDAADEITRLRNNVEQLQSEVADAKRWAMQERSRRWALQDPLSDAEREAVERAADLIDAKTCGDSATLRGLLERTK